MMGRPLYWEKDADDGTARKRKRGSPKGRFMDAAREDMAVVEVTEEDAEDRLKLRWKIRCGNPGWEERFVTLRTCEMIH